MAMMRRGIYRTARRAAGLLLVLAQLSACGTKGPLYLPTPEQKAQQQKQQQDNKQQPPRQ
jgi:predicted small lipoprotein YifL